MLFRHDGPKNLLLFFKIIVVEICHSLVNRIFSLEKKNQIPVIVA